MNLITCEACAIILWSSYVNTKSINWFALQIADRIIQWVPNLKPRYRNISLCEFGPKNVCVCVVCSDVCVFHLIATFIWCWSPSWQLYVTFIMVNCVYLCVRTHFGCRIYVTYIVYYILPDLCCVLSYSYSCMCPLLQIVSFICVIFSNTLQLFWVGTSLYNLGVSARLPLCFLHV